MGLTYEPQSKRWTLRAGSNPKGSPTGEISMLLSCLNEDGKGNHMSLVVMVVYCMFLFLMITWFYALQLLKYFIILL